MGGKSSRMPVNYQEDFNLGWCEKIPRKMDGEPMVCKVVDTRHLKMKFVLADLKILRDLDHEHITKYYDPIGGPVSLRIITEHCEGGDLSSYIEKAKYSRQIVDESFVWKVCYQLVSAVKTCHSPLKRENFILHRNIQTRNVLLTANQDVKLGNFGVGLTPSKRQTTRKWDPFGAPELLACAEYDEKCDMWSLGCVFLTLCQLRNPRIATDQEDIDEMIGETHSYYSSELVTFITSILQIDPKRRSTAKQLSSHPRLLECSH